MLNPAYNMQIVAGAIGGGELAIILLAALLLFGAKRLPELARALGQSLREFKKAARDVEEEIDTADKHTPLDSNKKNHAPPAG